MLSHYSVPVPGTYEYIDKHLAKYNLFYPKIQTFQNTVTRTNVKQKQAILLVNNVYFCSFLLKKKFRKLKGGLGASAATK